MLVEPGEVELGGTWLDCVDTVLLGIVDASDSLSALDGPTLTCDGCDEPDGAVSELAESPVLLATADCSDEAAGLVESPELPDCGEVD